MTRIAPSSNLPAPSSVPRELSFDQSSGAVMPQARADVEIGTAAPLLRAQQVV